MKKFIKNNQIWIILILVLINVATLSFIWFNKPPEKEIKQGTEMQREKMHRYMGQRLGMNETQMNGLKKIQDEHFQKMLEIRKNIRDKKRLLYDKMFEEKADEKEVQELISELGKLYEEQEEINYEHIKKIKAICTPQQAVEMKKMLQNILVYHNHRRNRNKNYKKRNRNNQKFNHFKNK